MRLTDASPSVCALMVTAGRPHMAAAVLDQFEAQTYDNRRLLVLDTGRHRGENHVIAYSPLVRIVVKSSLAGVSYGVLINQAATMALSWLGRVDYFAIMDDDDWSAPDRLSDQVHLIEATGTDLVGYHAMYFVDERPGGEVWQYEGEPGVPLGTSFLFRASEWASRPFDDQMIGADSAFSHGCDLRASCDGRDPLMMVARIHTQSVSARAGHRNMKRFEGGDMEPFTKLSDAAAIARIRAVFEIPHKGAGRGTGVYPEKGPVPAPPV